MEENSGREKQIIIVTVSVLKSYIFKKFSIRTKTESGRFQFQSYRRNKAAFSNSSSLLWTLFYWL